MRDLRKNYAPLERLFCVLNRGEMFGESCMFAPDSTKMTKLPRFY